MIEDFTSEDDEYFWDESLIGMYPDDLIMDDDSGLTYRNVLDALRYCFDEKGHSGPYTFEEFYQALLEVTVGRDIDHLVELGLIEKVMSRDGEMLLKLAPGVAEAIEAQENEQN